MKQNSAEIRSEKSGRFSDPEFGKEKLRFCAASRIKKGRLMGLEPMSAGATIQCVNQLHHNRQVRVIF